MMSEKAKGNLIAFVYTAVSAVVVFLVIILISGCSLIEPTVDYALAQAQTAALDALAQAQTTAIDGLAELVHEMAEKPRPSMPPAGSSLTEYGVWGGSVLLGSLAVLVDRRFFHKKQRRQGVPGVRPVGPPPPMPKPRQSAGRVVDFGSPPNNV